jgi:PAS domain S-box-containing protein
MTIGDDRPEGDENTAYGVPAEGTMDVGDREPLASRGLHHWRESTITRSGLDDRGNVFFAAIEMTRMPMILSDPNLPDNPIVFANKAFLDLTGYEEEEVLGRNCRFLQGALTDRETVAEMREAIAAHESIAAEIQNYRRDGTPFWNAVFIGPVYDTSGKLLYFFASQLDVTRRRNTEQSYRQAQKMEAIGQLTAGLAHDFNNLLQVVNGNLELMAARIGDDSRSRRYVESARAAAERGAKLTRQLLAFARKTRLEPRAVELGALLGSFREMLESAVNQHLHLEYSIEPDLPRIVVDADQLEMALLNVVLNARDASPAGATVVIATCRRTLDKPAGIVPAGDYISLEVRDQGTGMPPEIVERATEPFFTTKGVGKGTGLGLAMASGFVRQSRGWMQIESAAGKGTTVRMFFTPSSAGAEDAGAPPAARTDERPTSRAESGGAEHILVVEDNPEVLDLAREILASAGYRVSTATSGEEGWALFQSTTKADRVDLLFTDLIMPGGMNGLALAEKVIATDETVSVLLTTGYNEDLVAGTQRNPGADVLSKPYRRSELLDRTRQALNRRGSGGPRRRQSEYGVAEA